MSTFDAKAFWRKREEEDKNLSSSSKTTNSKSFDARSFWKKNEAEKTINLNTLQTDLESLGKSVDSVYKGWQTDEIMNNTLSSVQSMYDRLGKYQEYQKSYGGPDLSEIQNAYKGVLDNFGGLSNQYKQYKSADEYKRARSNAMRQAQELEAMKTADLGVVQTEIKDIESKLAVAKEYDKKAKDLGNSLKNIRGLKLLPKSV
jgi:methionine synthase II (cobalamin-independent)